MARYSRCETSAMPAGPAATAVSSGLYRGRDGARSCRRAYGGVLTLAFLPLGPLLVFQQGLSSGSAEACNTPSATHEQAASAQSPCSLSASAAARTAWRPWRQQGCLACSHQVSQPLPRAEPPAHYSGQL